MFFGADLSNGLIEDQIEAEKMIIQSLKHKIKNLRKKENPQSVKSAKLKKKQLKWKKRF